MSFFSKPCDFVRWGRIDLWDVFEASHILAGIEPSRDPNAFFEPEADEIYKLMSRALGVGGLNLVAGPLGQPFFCPLQVITWAEKKGLPIPPNLKSEVVRAAALIIDNQREKEAPKVPPAENGYELSEATKNALKRFGGPSSPLKGSLIPEPLVDLAACVKPPREELSEAAIVKSKQHPPEDASRMKLDLPTPINPPGIEEEPVDNAADSGSKDDKVDQCPWWQQKPHNLGDMVASLLAKYPTRYRHATGQYKGLVNKSALAKEIAKRINDIEVRERRTRNIDFESVRKRL